MYYAYFLIDENLSGIVKSWNECQEITKGKNSRFKKFKSINEAEKWINDGATYTKKNINKDLLSNAVYFDSGTGRLGISEIKVSDVNGSSLLNKIMPKKLINEFGNYYLNKHRTNNYGELSALYIALKYCIKYNILNICGDSKLVIDYWSKNNYSKKNIDNDTEELIKKVYLLRIEFEKIGGKIHKINGDINPADLGFHK